LTIRVRVLYFGQAREAAGTGWEDVSIPSSSSVKSLVRRSVKAHRGLQAISSLMRIAVNEEIAWRDRRLSEGDVVAFLPPVAGG
jgi:molybdopterin converting factor subunit 1